MLYLKGDTDNAWSPHPYHGEALCITNITWVSWNGSHFLKTLNLDYFLY